MPQTTFIASLIVLVILGIFDSGYLIRKRTEKQPLSCPIDGQCEKVTESRWNHLLGIKNDFLGLIYYFIILALTILIFIVSENQALFVLSAKLVFAAKLISGAALFFSLILTFIQFKIIKEYCFYCLISAGITLLIFLNSLVL